MTLSLTLDFIVIALLIATIVYAFILNKKLAALHDSKEELRQFLETFAQSLSQAKSGVDYLKKISYESSKDLQENIRQAKALRDELSFFVERGEQTISQLEKGIQTNRPSNVEQLVSKKNATKKPPPPEDSKAVHQKIEPRLVQALRGLR